MADPTYYSTADKVKAYTGVRPSDFGLSDISGGDTAETQLTNLLTAWLTEATDLMNMEMGKSYLSTTIPAGVHNIATRIVANMCAQAVLRRETPVIHIGEYATKMVDDMVLTPAIMKDLRRYRSTGSIRFFVPDVYEDDDDEEST